MSWGGKECCLAMLTDLFDTLAWTLILQRLARLGGWMGGYIDEHEIRAVKRRSGVP